MNARDDAIFYDHTAGTRVGRVREAVQKAPGNCTKVGVTGIQNCPVMVETFTFAIQIHENPALLFQNAGNSMCAG